MKLTDLQTPAALLDEARLDANLARMQAQADRLGVALRPHVKTHKCLPVAQRQRALGARGVTVSTLKEAEAFFDAGFDDIVYAIGLSPDKIGRVQALRQRGCRLKVLVDSVDAAQAVAAARAALEVLIEVDVDGARAGLAPDAPELLAVGRLLHDGGAQLAGVLTHCGRSYELHTPAALQAMAEQERARCVLAATRLREAGLPCPVVSVGSTPTALSARALAGVTEMRPGVYAFFDLVIAGTGVCSIDDVALSVLATVIGHQKDKGWALTDAGWMALSRDRGTQSQRVDWGYGLVCDASGRPLPGLQVQAASQEHGVIQQTDGAPPEDITRRLPIGTRVRVLPNHACATAAQHDRYHLVRGAELRDAWPRINGW